MGYLRVYSTDAAAPHSDITDAHRQIKQDEAAGHGLIYQ